MFNPTAKIKLDTSCVIAQSQKENVVNSKAKSYAFSLLEGEEPPANKQWCLRFLPRNSYDSLF